jgi:hypothetical protein
MHSPINLTICLLEVTRVCEQKEQNSSTIFNVVIENLILTAIQWIQRRGKQNHGKPEQRRALRYLPLSRKMMSEAAMQQ